MSERDNDEILPREDKEERPKRREPREAPTVRSEKRTAKGELAEEREEMSERAYFAKLIAQGSKEFGERELKLLELYDKNNNRTQKRLTNLYVEQRKFIYAQNEVMVTMRDIIQGALTSNVDLVNKYGELKAQGPLSKSAEWLELINGILSIPVLAAVQEAAVLYVTNQRGLPKKPEDPKEEESDQPE